MAIDIKTRMILEGEKEYSRGMKNAEGAIKELNSRLKVAKSEFEKTGDAQKYAADQAEILKAKIEEQEKAVNAAEEALKFFAENGVGESDAIMRKWRTTLNNSQAYLNRLQKELNDVTSAAGNSNKKIGEQKKAFENAGEEAENYKDTLERIDKNISFQTTLTKLSTVYNTVRNILGGIKDVSKEIWDFESQSAQWADEINTAASQAGVDAATYQSWRYASRFIDVTVDDLVNIQKKITEVMSNGSEESMMLFNQLGVPTRNADGSLRNSYDVMLDVANALGQISDKTTRSAIASKMLGEEYNKLWPLVDAGVPKWNALTAEAEQYGIVSQDSIDKLQALDDARQKLNAQTETLKAEIAGQLAPSFTEITNGLSTALTAFSDFLATDTGQDLIAKINGLLSELGKKIGEADFGAALEKLVGGLEWMIDNGEKLIPILLGIGGAFETFKVSKNVLDFLTKIKYLRDNSGSGTPAGTPVGTPAGAPSGTPSGTPAGAPITTSSGGAVTPNAGKLPGVVLPGGQLVALAGKGLALTALIGAGIGMSDPAFWPGVQRSFDGTIDTAGKIISGELDVWENSKGKTGLDVLKSAFSFGHTGIVDIPEAPKRNPYEEAAKAIAKKEIESLTDTSGEIDKEAAKKLKTAQEILDEMRSQVDISIRQLMNDTQNYMLVSGADMAIAYAEGIEANMWRATVAAAKMTAAVRMATGAGYVGGSIINANMTLEGETVARLISPAVDGYIGVNVEGR